MSLRALGCDILQVTWASQMQAPSAGGDLMMAGSNVRPIPRREKLRDIVGAALRAAIISGELQPGEIYTAPTLSEKFRVSATPVREAMIDLVREGLVEALPNRGYRVVEISDEDLDEVTELRSLIEPPTMGKITNLIPASDLPQLRVLAQAIVDAALSKDVVAFVEADTDFHLSLLAYSGNKRLQSIIADLRSRTRVFGLMPLAKQGFLMAAAEEHHHLLDLIEARQPEAVEEMMRRHIGKVRGAWADKTDAIAF